MLRTFPDAYGHAPATTTPVGRPCLACKVPIKDGDVGVVMPYIGPDTITDEPWHRRCFLASLGVDVGDA